MNYSYVETGRMSPGDTQPVSFAFRKRDEVFVMVDGVDVPSNLYGWVNDGLLQALSGFPSGTVTRIERRTPVGGYESNQSGAAVYDWNGANANFRQSLFVIQEYADKEARRNEQIEDITQSVEGMDQAVQAAQQSASDANQAASSAAANAAEAVSGVLQQAQAAANRATEAADRADQFDPLNFYTRSQADGTFLTYVSAQEDFFTKGQINTKLDGYYGKTAVDTALGQKVSKAGDTISGFLVIRSSAPTLNLTDSDGDVTRSVHHNAGNIGFLRPDGSWGMYLTDAGNVWSAAYGWFHDRFANAGSECQHNSGVIEFSGYDSGISDSVGRAPNPYVMIGLRRGNTGLGNATYIQCAALRNR